MYTAVKYPATYAEQARDIMKDTCKRKLLEAIPTDRMIFLFPIEWIDSEELNTGMRLLEGRITWGIFKDNENE